MNISKVEKNNPPNKLKDKVMTITLSYTFFSDIIDMVIHNHEIEDITIEDKFNLINNIFKNINCVDDIISHSAIEDIIINDKLWERYVYRN